MFMWSVRKFVHSTDTMQVEQKHMLIFKLKDMAKY